MTGRYRDREGTISNTWDTKSVCDSDLGKAYMTFNIEGCMVKRSNETLYATTLKKKSDKYTFDSHIRCAYLAAKQYY